MNTVKTSSRGSRIIRRSSNLRYANMSSLRSAGADHGGGLVWRLRRRLFGGGEREERLFEAGARDFEIAERESGSDERDHGRVGVGGVEADAVAADLDRAHARHRC